MSNPKTYITKANIIKINNFNPRNYDPVFLFVENKLKEYPEIRLLLTEDVKGGSTPPYYLFRKEYDVAVPFVKTSAISRDFINMDDLHYIHPKFHQVALKRSITKPYDLIYSMTGKFMGKAALCPPCVEELNMSQNSVVLRTSNPYLSAFLCIYLNSTINKEQVKGLYSITKQKYINQGKIQKLKVINYDKKFDSDIELYLTGINDYYKGIENIKKTILDFEQNIKIDYNTLDKSYCFKTHSSQINLKILTPQFYRNDFNAVIDNFSEAPSAKKLVEHAITKGNEIGSDNYLFEGIPFIKTSDLLNYGVDYNPNYYCSKAIYNEIEQDLHMGDILFTKDGKVGEIAILEESARVVICSGILRIRAENENERYYLFLLLSSMYGKIYFNKWTVIASTMAHLRKDFLVDFKIPLIPNSLKQQYINNIKHAFKLKKDAWHKVEKGKTNILNRLYHIMES
jgi:type I restriction enzyme S subunit